MTETDTMKYLAFDIEIAFNFKRMALRLETAENGGQVLTQDEKTTCRCRYCGEQTPALEVKICDLCLELERQIYASPERARQIFATMIQWLETPAGLAFIKHTLGIEIAHRGR